MQTFAGISTKFAFSLSLCFYGINVEEVDPLQYPAAFEDAIPKLIVFQASARSSAEIYTEKKSDKSVPCTEYLQEPRTEQTPQ
jgi:hypothetical protein